MGLINLQENPEWQAAIAREQLIRERAYLGLPTPIGDERSDLSLLPLTLRQVTLLSLSENAVLFGEQFTGEDCVNFLWACDPGYVPGDAAAKECFVAGIDALERDWPAIGRDLRIFYVDSMIDAPRLGRKRSSEPQAPALCAIATYEGFLKAQFPGVPYDTVLQMTLDMPVVLLNQRRRHMLMQEEKHGISGGAYSIAVEKAAVKAAQKAAAAAKTS